MVRKSYERVIVWEVSWRLNKDCNILTPSSSGYSSTSSSFSWLLNRGPWGPSLYWDLVRTTSNCNHWLPTLISNSLELPVAPGYIIVWRSPASVSVASALNSTRPQSRLSPWYLWPDSPVIYIGAFLIWQLGRIGGQNVTLHLKMVSHCPRQITFLQIIDKIVKLF